MSDASDEESGYEDMPAIREMIGYAQPSRACSSQQMSRVSRFAMATREFLHQDALRLLQRSVGGAILCWYSNDTTPMVTRTSMSTRIGNLLFRNRVRQSGEHVIQRLFFQTSQGETALVLSEPQRVSDKTAATHFGCYRELFPYPRSVMPSGIMISAHVWDGALYSACDKLHRQLMAAYHHSQSAECSEGDALWNELTHWFCSARCALHIAHCGLKRGVLQFTEDRMLLKRCWVTLESLRPSFVQLVRNLEAWVRARLVFEDRCMPHQPELLRALGVDTELADRMVELQMCWDPHGGKLIVGFQHSASATIVADVCAVIQATWRFRAFSESRWIGLGPSARALTLATLYGLEDLVSFVLKVPGESKYYIQGFSQYDSQVKRCMSVIGMSSYLADSVLAILLEDDRLCMVIGSIEEEIETELAWVSSVGAEVWQAIAVGMRFDGNLGDECISSALASAGYISEGFRYIKQYPWGLALGDADIALDRLASEGKPEEETAGKIWTLLTMGMDRSAIKTGLELMRKASHAALTTEQAHAAGSIMMKWHRMYGDATMRDRSYIYQAKPLLVESVADRKLRRLCDRLRKVKERNPNKVGARQAWVADMISVASKQKADGRVLHKDYAKHLLKRHGALWSRMAPDRQDRFEQRAEQLREEAWLAKQSLQAQLASDIEAARQRRRERDFDDPLLTRVGSHRFSRLRLKELQDFIAAYPLTDLEVSNRREANCLEKGPPNDMVLHTLGAFDVQQVTHRPHRYPWLSLVSRNRDMLAGSLFRFGIGENMIVLYFVYALQNPMVCCFAHAQEAEVREGPGEALQQLRSADAYIFEHNYNVQMFDFVFSDEPFTDPSAPVSVLFNCVFRRDGWIVGEGDWLPLGEVAVLVRSHIPEEPLEEEQKADRSESKPVPLWAEFPWLMSDWASLGIDGGGKRPDGGRNSGSGMGAPPDEDPGEWAGFTAEEVLTELEALRASYVHEPAPSSDFKCALRGGAWTASMRGVLADSWRGECASERARRFCKLAGMPLSGTFSIPKFTDSHAQSLSHFWCDRMRFWLGLWLERGATKDVRFMQEDAALFEEPEWAAELESEASAPTLSRLAELRAMRPNLV